jgi:protein dithiol:quinone oxidoreductase
MLKLDSKKLITKKGFAIGGFFCLILLGIAYFLEYHFKLNPCPLCLLQRYVLWIMTVLFFMGSFSAKKITGYLYSILLFIFGLLGCLLALRQIWLQHLPKEQVPSCTAGLQRMLEIYPILDVFKIIFNSASECATEQFSIFGLSLIGFIILVVITTFILILIKKRRV